jgi:hypothetical protein
MHAAAGTAREARYAAAAAGTRLQAQPKALYLA